MIRPIGLRYRNSIKFCIQDATHATSENTLREFPLVIATVAKVSRKRGLWLVVRVKNTRSRMFPAAGRSVILIV